MLGDFVRVQQQPDQEVAQIQANLDASRLAVDAQQIAFALRDGGGEDRNDVGMDVRQAPSTSDSNGAHCNGDDSCRAMRIQQSRNTAHLERSVSSKDAHRVVPDLRDDEHVDQSSKPHGTDRDIQERAALDTVATTTASATADGVRASVPSTDPDRSSILSVDFAIWNIVQLLRPSTVLDTRIYMSLGVLMLSFVLGACALCFRDEIFAATHMNAGLLLGSVGTLAMCSIIIGTYLTTKWYRRHMHILLLNLAVYDLLLALSFVLEPVWTRVGAGVGAGLSCRWLSIVREYLIMCSTTWTMCMALDLYYLMTDPFTSPRMNRSKYQLIVHAFAGASAVIMAVSHAFDAPVAVGGFCWVGAPHEDANGVRNGRNGGIWLFIVAPAALAIGGNSYVACVSYRRFRDGISATLKPRRALLHEGFFSTATVVVYAALLWGVYGAFWVAATTAYTQVLLSHLFAFLLSYRGSVAFVLWCLYKRPTQTVAAPQSTQRETTDGCCSTIDPSDDDNDSSDDDDDDAERPQMNTALLQELMWYTTTGIALAVQNAQSHSNAPADGDDRDDDTDAPLTFLLPPPTGTGRGSRQSSRRDVAFTAFRPRTFARLRECVGIADVAFVRSLARCSTPKVHDGGASGAFQFRSRDRRFVVKALSCAESRFLHSRFLGAYTAHLTTQPDSCLTRFLGSFCVVLYGQRAHFVVMANVLDVPRGVTLTQCYDLKGSWVDRHAKRPTHGTEVTCRYCHLTFRYTGNSHRNSNSKCPAHTGPHEPNVVRKDMDLTTNVCVGTAAGAALKQTLKRDSDFLCSQGVTDYSLLVGIVDVRCRVDPQQLIALYCGDSSSVSGGPRVVVDTDCVSTNTTSTNSSISSDHTAAPTTTTHTHQSMQCVRAAEVVVGPGVYYVGIIDMLQRWTLAKRVERIVKTVVLRKDPDGISAMAPRPYCLRFHRKLDEIIDVGSDTASVSATMLQLSPAVASPITMHLRDK